MVAIHCAAVPLAAQEAQPDDSQEPQAPVREPIDIEPIERSDTVELPIVTPRDSLDQKSFEQCEIEQDASTISGEIIVCREVTEDNSNYYSGSRENARKRYAEETAFRDDPLTPDFILDCHDLGYPAGCFRLGRVPPPALIIDVAALPQAPAGSDADRIARGLPPLGNDVGDAEEIDPNQGPETPELPVSQEESEAPTEER